MRSTQNFTGWLKCHITVEEMHCRLKLRKVLVGLINSCNAGYIGKCRNRSRRQMAAYIHMEGGILDRSAKRSEKNSKDVINCIVCSVQNTYQVKVMRRSVQVGLKETNEAVCLAWT